MRLNIIDPATLDLIGVLTNYESVQWSPTFNTPDGTFQINCETEYIDLLKVERLIENTDEPEHIGVVKSVQTVITNTKETLQINGMMLEKDIFYSRVVKNFIMYQDVYPTEVIGFLIGLTLQDPPEASRKLATLGEVIIPDASDVPDIKKQDYSANYPNLGDEIYTLIQNMGIGVKARINRETMRIDIEFYTGHDLTFGSDDPVVFSPERGTVTETTYKKDSSQNFTHLVLIGEDNLIFQAAREDAENAPLREKSIDVSSECPWPTYKVEKPNEEGGSYYRYKKYTPPADWVVNRDVWEKYAVDRIETEQTLYREVEVQSDVPTTVEQVLNTADMFANTSMSSTGGRVTGSTISVAAGVAAAATALSRAPSGTSKKVGTKVQKRADGAKSIALLSVDVPEVAEEGAVFIDDPNAVKPPRQGKPLLRAASPRPDGGVQNGHTKVASGKTNVSSTHSGGGTASRNNLPVRTDIFAQMNQLTQTVEYYETTYETEEYNVTSVTYETKDFLEYVYVNTGESPSTATKIIQGSVASGDVMYYENFEDVKVTEAKYKEVLMKKAEEYLKTFVVSELVNVTPYFLGVTTYGSAYKLGDIVTARNGKLGYAIDLRITQALESWDSKGYNVSVDLGDSIPTLTNRIKLIAKGGA